jgi:hypothetical protein
VLQKAAFQIEIHYANRGTFVLEEALSKTTFRSSDHQTAPSSHKNQTGLKNVLPELVKEPHKNAWQ